jgi:hypothetical protein
MSQNHTRRMLFTFAESLSLSYSTDIEVVIDESYGSDTQKCKYYKIGLVAIPETMSHAESYS